MIDEKIIELVVRKSKREPETVSFKVRKINGCIAIEDGMKINATILRRIIRKYNKLQYV
jgi:hypothetical protein